MSEELRQSMVAVGQETAPTAQNANTVVLSYDANTGLMQPVKAEDILPKSGVTTVSVATTVTVGTGGDFATINEAIEFLSGLYPVYKSGGITATINLLSGFIVQEQVLVTGIDLRWITIISEDVEVAIDATAITTQFQQTKPVFGVFRGTLPIIGSLFSFGTNPADTSICGVHAVEAATVIMTYGAGVRFSGGHGMFITRSCVASCTGANFSNATQGGILCTGNSKVNAPEANLNDVGLHAIYLLDGGYGNFASATALNAGTTAVFCSDNSRANIEGVDSTGSASVIYIIGGVILSARNFIGTITQAVNTVSSAGIIFR